MENKKRSITLKNNAFCPKCKEYGRHMLHFRVNKNGSVGSFWVDVVHRKGKYPNRYHSHTCYIESVQGKQKKDYLGLINQRLETSYELNKGGKSMIKNIRKGSQEEKVCKIIIDYKEPMCIHQMSEALNTNVSNASGSLTHLVTKGILTKCLTKGTCEKSNIAHTFYNYLGRDEMIEKRTAKTIDELRQEHKTELEGLKQIYDNKLAIVIKENKELSSLIQHGTGNIEHILRQSLQKAEARVSVLKEMLKEEESKRI